jgi:hypothetical protein
MTEGATVFREKTPEEAPPFWIATSDLTTTPANAFYQKLDGVLSAFTFGDAVRRLAASSVRISGPPTFTIGSMAIVIPATSRGPRLGLP